MAQVDKKTSKQKVKTVQPTATAPEPPEGPGQPVVTAPEPPEGPGQRVVAAQRQHAESVNQTSAALNEDLAKAYRDCVGAQYAAHAQFMESLDQPRLQEALKSANEAYWRAVDEIRQSSMRRQVDSFQSYLGAIRDAVAAIDEKSVDACTLQFLARSLDSAAALAASQQQQQQWQQQQQQQQQQQVLA